jgi:hypothetical protein
MSLVPIEREHNVSNVLTEIIGIGWNCHAEHTDTLCGQNAVFMRVHRIAKSDY